MVSAEMTMTEETHKPDGDSTTGDLNEILRLQAVALARMSERINAQYTSPVKALPPLQERSGLHMPILTSDAALSEDSMPVLNAFREFLDQERRRTRARILWISLLFAVLFAASVAAILWLGRERLQELRADIGVANRKVDASRERASDEIKKISETATRSVTAMKRDMSMAQSAIVSNLNDKLQNRDVETELLKEKLSNLEIENAMLIGRMRDSADRAEARQATEEAADADGAEMLDPMDDNIGVVTDETNDVVQSKDMAPIVIQTPSYNRPVRLKVPRLSP